MSRYVTHVLQPGETVAFDGTIHWLVYGPAIFFALVTIGGVVLSQNNDLQWVGYGLGALGLVFALISFVRARFARFTTEIAVTDRRVILKRGFIRRQTIEMNMSKVESVDVNQSILGRMLDYGDILVRGTGAGLEPLNMIAHPLAFRNAVIAR